MSLKVESKIEIRRFLNHIKARLNDIDDKICDVVSSVISPTESVQHHQKLSNERYKKGLVRKIVATEGREDLCRRTEFIIPPGKSAHFWKLFLGEAKALVADLKTRNSKNQTLSAEEFWKQLKELPQPKKDKTLAALREIVEKRPCS